MTTEPSTPLGIDPAPRAERRPLRIGFVKLVVEDLERMGGFYRAALDLEALHTIETEVLREVVLGRPGREADLRLVLVQHREPRPIVLGSAYGAICLMTEDVDGAYARAIAAGARPHRPPSAVAAGRVAFVLDPDGREIEFLDLQRRS